MLAFWPNSVVMPHKKGDIKRKIAQEHINLWGMAVAEASRLKCYASVKKEYSFEKYLLYIVRKVRCAFPCFRISTHNLRIERDQWNKTNRLYPKLTDHVDAATPAR